jgi:hypothetical protein
VKARQVEDREHGQCILVTRTSDEQVAIAAAAEFGGLFDVVESGKHYRLRPAQWSNFDYRHSAPGPGATPGFLLKRRA